jgi:hypothetical protein
MIMAVIQAEMYGGSGEPQDKPPDPDKPAGVMTDEHDRSTS